MKIILNITKGNKPSHVFMSTKIKRDEDDTPRIHVLGRDIRQALDEIIANCEKEGIVNT